MTVGERPARDCIEGKDEVRIAVFDWIMKPGSKHHLFQLMAFIRNQWKNIY